MSMRRFLKNSTGNMAIMLSLAAVPILLAAGAAIDTLRANDTQTLLQAASDAAAIAGAKGGAVGDAAIKKIVTNYLQSNGAVDALSEVDSITQGKAKNGNFFVSITGKFNTSFMAVAGYSTMDMNAYSEVAIGGSGLELAMVLDTTGSMNETGKIDALKVAAKQMVQDLLQNKDPSVYVKIGMVPFANYVNVGVANRNKFWLNVPADYTDPQSCGNTYPNAQYSNCHDVPYSYQNCSGGGDGVPPTCSTVTGTSQQCDTVNYGNPVWVCYPGAQHTWNGIVGSIGPNNDTDIAPSDKYPGLMDLTASNPIIDLTNDQTVLTAGIDALAANGETYIPGGLIWGWNLLDPKGAFSKAKTVAQMNAIHGTKALILMTDGENTKSANYPYHDAADTPTTDVFGNVSSVADDKTATLCTNIKKAGITIYTVAFKVNTTRAKNLLDNCASDPGKMFSAQDNAALQAAFADIAGSLIQVSLTK